MAQVLTYRDLMTDGDIDIPEPATPTKSQVVKLSTEIYNNYARVLQKALKKYKPKKVKPVKSDNKSVIGLCTDVHLGKLVIIDKKDIYTIDEAKRRLKEYFTKLAYHTIEVDADELVIALGGDMVEGEGLIYRSQAWNIEAVLIDQVKEITVSFWEFLMMIKAIFKEHKKNIPMRIICVRGNHGENKGSDRTNWDSVFYWNLQLASKVSNDKSISIVCSDDDFANFSVKGWNYHLRHKLPALSLSNATRGVILGHAQNHKADVMLTGHWHNLGIGDYNKVLVVYNGCVGGGDSFADGLSLDSVACQCIIDVTQKEKMANLKPISFE